MKKIISILIIAIVVLAGCSGGKDNTKVLRRPTTEVESLDLTMASYAQTFDLYESIYEALYVIDGNGTIQPGVAKSDPEISDDGLTYTVKLKDNAKWVNSKGEEQRAIVAEDFVYAWQRMVNPETKAQYSYIMELLAGYDEASKGELDKLGVKAIDPTTLEIKLAYSAPYFKEMLAFAAFAPIAKEMVEEKKDAYGQAVDSVWYNGPFYLEKYDKVSTTNAKKNENYWDVENVALDGINYITMKDASTQFSSFQSGEIDMANIPSPEQHKVATETMKDSLNYRAEAGTMVFYLNMESGPTTNLNFRKAIQSAMDVDKIANDVYGSGTKSAHAFVPGELTKGSYGFDFREKYGQLTSYNVEKAKEYMALAESEMGKKANEITIDLLVAEGDTNRTLAEFTQSQLSTSLGINVNVVTQAQQAYSQTRNQGGFHMAYGGWSADYGDAGNFLGLMQSSLVDSLNTSRFKNESYDSKFVEANKIGDSVQRNDAFAELEKFVVQDEATLVPLVSRGKDRLLNPKFNVPTHPIYKVSSKYITIK